jgi:hypothetical protein
VNTVADSDNPADPTLSLREAIAVCNGTLSVGTLSATAQLQVQGTLATPNTIDFAIPGSGVQTIQPATDLPMITVPMIINGSTQPGGEREQQPGHPGRQCRPADRDRWLDGQPREPGQRSDPRRRWQHRRGRGDR